MFENMFFLDSKYVGIGGMLTVPLPPPKKRCLFVHVIYLVSKNYFTWL